MRIFCLCLLLLLLFFFFFFFFSFFFLSGIALLNLRMRVKNGRMISALCSFIEFSASSWVIEDQA